jgi:tetratricopeptide (TPR) repeat protein
MFKRTQLNCLCTLAGLVLLFSGRAFAQSTESPDELYKRYRSAEAQWKAKASVDGGKTVALAIFGLGPELDEEASAKRKLEDLAKTNAGAAFYAGVIDLEDAQRGNENDLADGRPIDQFSRELADQALENFRRASAAGIAEAFWNIGVLHENKLLAHASNLAAVEWYAKAGYLYVKHGRRDQALEVLEKIEALGPDQPDSKKLRAMLFPPPKKTVK